MLKVSLLNQLAKLAPDFDPALWFDSLGLEYDAKDRRLAVTLPHAFFRPWFDREYKKLFEQAGRLCGVQSFFYQGRPVAVQGACPHQMRTQSAGVTAEGEEALPERYGPGNGALPGLSVLPGLDGYSFGEFLVNKKNDFPLAAAREVVRHVLCPPHVPPYTPVVFYGQSGSGKTHMLGAMANSLHEAGRQAFWGGLEQLDPCKLGQSIASLLDFDALFLDDIQRLAPVPDAQEALAALIDACCRSRRLLVFSLDVHPAIWASAAAPLRSRLASGLVTELKRPDLDIRHQYVHKKNVELSLGLGKDHLFSLAQRYEDIRSINGALNRLSLYRLVSSAAREGNAVPGPATPPSLTRTDVALVLTRESARLPLTAEEITATVARFFSLDKEELVGKSRDKAAVLARQIAMLLCRELLGLSLMQTGKAFGGRDHTSVLYSLKKIKEMQDRNKDTNNKVKELKKLCLSRTG